MTKGQYVFYTIEMLPEENVLNPQDVWASNDGQNLIAKQAFEAVFHVRTVPVGTRHWNSSVVSSRFKNIPFINLSHMQ